jgi:hypothetical protein
MDIVRSRLRGIKPQAVVMVEKPVQRIPDAASDYFRQGRTTSDRFRLRLRRPRRESQRNGQFRTVPGPSARLAKLPDDRIDHADLTGAVDF